MTDHFAPTTDGSLDSRSGVLAGSGVQFIVGAQALPDVAGPGETEGSHRTTRDRLVPYCMFTDPPLARVGLSEGEAKRQAIAVRVAKLPMSAVLRTRTTDETQGFMKVLVGAADDRILGFTMIGSDAGEVMAAVQTAMLARLPFPALRDAILAHPTMAEGLGALFSNVPPKPAARDNHPSA